MVNGPLRSDECPELGPGWEILTYARKASARGNSISGNYYKIYVAPDGTRLKSMVQAQAHIAGELCVQCRGDCEPGNEILLCDTKGCKAAWHQQCLPEPLLEVPEGDWYCPRCVQRMELEVASQELGDDCSGVPWSADRAALGEDANMQPPCYYCATGQEPVEGYVFPKRYSFDAAGSGGGGDGDWVEGGSGAIGGGSGGSGRLSGDGGSGGGNGTGSASLALPPPSSTEALALQARVNATVHAAAVFAAVSPHRDREVPMQLQPHEAMRPACIIEGCQGTAEVAGSADNYVRCSACGHAWQSAWWFRFLTDPPPAPPPNQGSPKKRTRLFRADLAGGGGGGSGSGGGGCWGDGSEDATEGGTSNAAGEEDERDGGDVSKLASPKKEKKKPGRKPKSPKAPASGEGRCSEGGEGGENEGEGSGEAGPSAEAAAAAKAELEAEKRKRRLQRAKERRAERKRQRQEQRQADDEERAEESSEDEDEEKDVVDEGEAAAAAAEKLRQEKEAARLAAAERKANFEDCGTCVMCLDKKKFGGPGVKKKPCVQPVPKSNAAATTALATPIDSTAAPPKKKIKQADAVADDRHSIAKSSSKSCAPAGSVKIDVDDDDDFDLTGGKAKKSSKPVAKPAAVKSEASPQPPAGKLADAMFKSESPKPAIANPDATKPGATKPAAAAAKLPSVKPACSKPFPNARESPRLAEVSATAAAAQAASNAAGGINGNGNGNGKKKLPRDLAALADTNKPGPAWPAQDRESMRP